MSSFTQKKAEKTYKYHKIRETACPACDFGAIMRAYTSWGTTVLVSQTCVSLEMQASQSRCDKERNKLVEERMEEIDEKCGNPGQTKQKFLEVY